MEKNLKEVFKANDIRGVYGKILDDDLAYKVGRAIAKFFRCKEIFIGRDMRLSSPALFKALVRGLNESGVDAINLGLVDTPLIYFATGFYKKPGIMITASHNPAEYNGIKIVKAGARPVDSHNGFNKIRKNIENNSFIWTKIKGKIIKKDIFEEYKNYVLSFIDLSKINRIKVVVDAGNGMAGKIAPIIYKNLGVNIIPLYFKLDGEFPNHVPNPIIKKNLRVLAEKVRKEKANFGIAFDGDMDRVVFVDEKGRFVNTSFIGSLLAKYILQKSRGSRKPAIIYSSAASRIMSEAILKYGGRPLREKVGHAYIKGRMRKKRALFGMEHSAHYYYRNNYYADSGLITSLLVFEIYSLSKKQGLKFSDLLKEFDKYSQAEEVSFLLQDSEDILEKIEKYYVQKKDSKSINHFDGLTIEFSDYWFSVRKSNTEPLLRINLEAVDKITMKEKLKEVLKVVKR